MKGTKEGHLSEMRHSDHGAQEPQTQGYVSDDDLANTSVGTDGGGLNRTLIESVTPRVVIGIVQTPIGRENKTHGVTDRGEPSKSSNRYNKKFYILQLTGVRVHKDFLL